MGLKEMFSNIDGSTIVIGLIAITFIVFAICFWVEHAKKNKEEKEQQKDDTSGDKPGNEDKRESFTVVMNGKNEWGNIGSVTGDFVATTGTTWGDAEGALIKDGRIDYVDGGDNGKVVTLGAVSADGEGTSPLDAQMEKHNEVLRIANPDNRNYCDHDEHTQIANLVHGAGSNDVNMFKRGTTKSLKMSIDPLGTQMVIDEKYLPEKDRHGSMKVVKNVIAGKGYDVNVERLGENLAGFSWGKIGRVRLEDRERGVIQGVGVAGTGSVETDNRGAGMESAVAGSEIGKYGMGVIGNSGVEGM